MLYHDTEFFRPLEYAEQVEERLEQFYHRNPITRIWALWKALPTYLYSLKDIVEMIADCGTEFTIDTLENAYLTHA